MGIKKKIRLFVLVLMFLAVITLQEACKKKDIIGDWKVEIKYNGLTRGSIIPENSIFRFERGNVFYINGKKTSEKYKKKGKIIRVKILLKKSKYVIRGIFIDSNTIKGEIKKIITDDEIATWIAKKKK